MLQEFDLGVLYEFDSPFDDEPQFGQHALAGEGAATAGAPKTTIVATIRLTTRLTRRDLTALMCHHPL